MSKGKERLTVTIREHKLFWVGVFIGVVALILTSFCMYRSIEQNNTILIIFSTVLLIAILYILNKAYFIYEDTVLEVKRART